MSGRKTLMLYRLVINVCEPHNDRAAEERVLVLSIWTCDLKQLSCRHPEPQLLPPLEAAGRSDGRGTERRKQQHDCRR
jgi:hypothetical protein